MGIRLIFIRLFLSKLPKQFEQFHFNDFSPLHEAREDVQKKNRSGIPQ